MVYLAVKQINWDEFFLLSSKIQPFYFLICPIPWILVLVVSSYKSFIIIRYNQINTTFLKCIKVNYIGLFSNNFLPGGLGADTMKFLYFKDNYRASKLLIASLILDKIIGLINLILLSVLFGFFLLNKVLKQNFYLYYCLLILFFIVCLINIFLIPKYIKFFKSKIKLNLVLDFIDTIEQLNQFNIYIIIKVLLCYMIIFLLTIITYYLLFLALGSPINPTILLQVVPLIFIGEYIPLSINAIGIREGLSIFLFGIFSISSSVIFAITIISRCFDLFLSTIGGIIYLFDKQQFNFIKSKK